MWVARYVDSQRVIARRKTEQAAQQAMTKRQKTAPAPLEVVSEAQHKKDLTLHGAPD